MTRVHLVYPHGDAISCPDAIGRNVARHLRAHGHEVAHYEYRSGGVIAPGPDDVLLGHPAYHHRTIFRRSAQLPGWRRVVAMFPFQHGDLRQSAFAHRVLPDCDHVLAICGTYWGRRIRQSIFAPYADRYEQLDLAVDRADFPVIKPAFNPPGKRRVLYIGHTSWYKNPEYLRAIARAMPGTTFGWFGSGMHMPEVTAHGQRDFRDPAAIALIASYDFLLTVGRADANPTTVLEAAAWGLIPVCTPTSGYEGDAAIINVPLDDVPAAVAALERLQNLPEAELMAIRERNWQALDSHFTWKRFGEQVRRAVEDRTPRPPLGPFPWSDRLRLRVAELTSPWCPYQPMPALRFIARTIRNRRLPTT